MKLLKNRFLKDTSANAGAIKITGENMNTNKTTTVLITSLIMLLICSGTASAITHTVCATGCDFTTIQAAVTAASSYDTVYVYNGTYTENVYIGTAHLTIEGEGGDVVTVEVENGVYDHCFEVAAAYVNISGVSMSGANRYERAGIFISGDYCNISNNTIIKNTYGIHVSSSTGAVCQHNIIKYNNEYGMYLSSSNGNIITGNVFSYNVGDLNDAGSNTYTANQFTYNLKTTRMLTFVEINRRKNLNDIVNFNISMFYPNGGECSACDYAITTKPYEAVATSQNGNIVTGNFTLNRVGMYSMNVNITDSDNNIAKRKYVFLVDATGYEITKYYLRNTSNTHGQNTGADAGAMLFDAPNMPEEISCSLYVQNSPDEIPNYPISIIDDVNLSTWYKFGVSIPSGDIGIQQYYTFHYDIGTAFDEHENVPYVSDYTQIENNFINLNWAMDYSWSWYWIAVKLYGAGYTGAPMWISSPDKLSYTNITYLYSTTPAIKAISNIDIMLLSATSPASDDTSASIVLDGTGTTNLSVQMPNDALTYVATWDGGACTGGACSYTQAAGELNFTLSLGGLHTIEITEEGGVIPTYIMHLAAVTVGTGGNTITTTETCAGASFATGTLTGGTDGSDNYWADTQTGASMWGDMGGMMGIAAMVLIIGLLIGALKGGADIKVVVGAGVGLLMLVAVFSIAPGVGSDMQEIVNLDQGAYASGRLTFVCGGSVTDGETVTINATTLEYDLAGDGVTPGRVDVDISDGTAATASLNLTNAINNNATLAAIVTVSRGTI